MIIKGEILYHDITLVGTLSVFVTALVGREYSTLVWNCGKCGYKNETTAMFVMNPSGNFEGILKCQYCDQKNCFKS